MTPPINLADFEALAHAAMDPGPWCYFESGAEDELSLIENRAAFQRIKLRPRMLRDFPERNLSTTIFGHTISLPIILAPTSHQSLAHPQAEFATAAAAKAASTLVTLGTGNHFGVEEVSTTTQAPFWYQMYCYENRTVTKNIIRRAEAAGARALVLTIDASFAPRRERNRRINFRLPSHIEMRNMVGIGLQDHLLEAENGGMLAFISTFRPMLLTWDEIDWMRSITDTPILLKGILTAEDAELAVAHGVDGVIVSNHGGRQLDGTIAPIEALPEIADRVGHQIEVLVDGGFRRGTDVLKALALGARAVLIGRPYLWGLAVNGEAGVRQVIELLRDELRSAMEQCGQADVNAIERGVVRL